MELVILDRDGVINQKRSDYIKSADQWQPIPGSIEAIARLSRAGYTPVVATNQSGLARGLFDLDDLEAMHAKMTQLVEAEGGSLEAIFYCPHHPDDGCKCRKPKTGLLDAIEAEFNTSVAGAPFIGDSLRDLEAALAKACQAWLVLTGLGQNTRAELAQRQRETGDERFDQVRVVPDLAGAVEQLLSTHGAD